MSPILPGWLQRKQVDGIVLLLVNKIYETVLVNSSTTTTALLNSSKGMTLCWEQAMITLSTRTQTTHQSCHKLRTI